LNRTATILLLLGIALLGVYVYLRVTQPKEVDWRLTLSRYDKIPYGTYITYNQTQNLFPSAKVETIRQTVYDQVNNSEETSTAYVFIGQQIGTNETDENELLNYVANGNFVFMSAARMSKTLSDTLHFQEENFPIIPNGADSSVMALLGGGNDSTTISLVNPKLQELGKFTFFKYTIDGHFIEFDTLRTTVLGTTADGHANFIRINVGKGSFYIHAAPICFSNYFLLRGNNYHYSEAVLSYLPKNIKKLYWDEYYKIGNGSKDSDLHVIEKDANLRIAFYAALIGLFVFILLNLKRRQRMIPVRNILQNTSLEYVKTIGDLYFNSRDNRNIALKKVAFWLEFLRSRFGIHTRIQEPGFWQQVQHKSGFDEAQLQRLRQLIQLAESNNSISDTSLVQVSRIIDSFYKKVK
jgi:hypothetical protein